LKRRPTLSRKIKRAPGARRNYIPEAPIHRIVRTEKLDIWESTAAVDILFANRQVTGLPALGDIEMDMRLPTVFDAADIRASNQSDRSRIYSKWRTDMRDTVALRVTDAVMFSEHALTTIDAANRWPRGTALGHLTIALRHFAALRGNTPPGAARAWRYTPSLPTRKETK
jgi:hypothetical protein